MRESQNSVHNELAAIIRLSRWENRVSRLFGYSGQVLTTAYPAATDGWAGHGCRCAMGSGIGNSPISQVAS